MWFGPAGYVQLYRPDEAPLGADRGPPVSSHRLNVCVCSDGFPSSHGAPAEGPKVLFWRRRRILVAGGDLADPNVLVPPRPALLEHEGPKVRTSWLVFTRFESK